MCGRYSIYSSEADMQERFDAEMAAVESYRAHYNAAPSQHLPVILNEDSSKIELGEWGFVPHWIKEDSKLRPQINIRAETASQKPMFRDSFHKRRCLVLADNFFEWDRNHKVKTPYAIELKEKGLFAFAGLWDEIPLTKGRRITYGIITTEANGMVGKIHDRMPVILHRKDEGKWLDPLLDDEKAQALLSPYSARDMRMHPISTLVNSPRNNTKEILTQL